MDKSKLKVIHLAYVKNMNELTTIAKEKVINDVFKQMDVTDFIDNPDAFKKDFTDLFKLNLKDYLDQAVTEGQTLAKGIINGVQTGPQ